MEQPLQVALRAERYADPGQLADLAAAARRLGPRPGGLRPGRRFAIAGAHRHQQLSRADRVRQESGKQLGRQFRRHVRLAAAPERHDGATRVHERSQHVDREHGSAFGVEQEHARPLVHAQVARQAHFARIDLRPVERGRDAGRLPRPGVEQNVPHGSR